MVVFGQHAVPASCLRAIRIAGLVRFGVMHMMRNDINLLRYGFYHEILRQDPPQWMAKAKGLVRAIAVKPDGAMRTHDHHAINDNGDDQVPGEIFEEEEIKEGQHSCQNQEADERDPVFLCPEDIDPRKGLVPK